MVPYKKYGFPVTDKKQKTNSLLRKVLTYTVHVLGNAYVGKQKPAVTGSKACNRRLFGCLIPNKYPVGKTFSDSGIGDSKPNGQTLLCRIFSAEQSSGYHRVSHEAYLQLPAKWNCKISVTRV